MADDTPQSLLIVLTGSLGDVARGLAVIQPIRDAWPQCSISWVVDTRWSALVRGHPGVNEVIQFDRKSGLSGVFALVRALRQRRFDCVIDLQRTLKSALISRIPKSRRSIGFERSDSKEGNWLFHREHIAPFGSIKSKVDHYLLFLDRLGVARSGQVDFGLKSAVSQSLPDRLNARVNKGSIGVVLGSSWRSKDWPAEHYKALCEILIAESGRQVVLLGDRSVQVLGAELAAGKNEQQLCNLAGATSLEELIGVLRSVSIALGPDSGPGHIAAAVGTPYVTIFGPTLPSRVVPYGMESLIARAEVACSPCLKRECPGVGGICMRLVTPARVAEIVRAALAGSAKTLPFSE